VVSREKATGQPQYRQRRKRKQQGTEIREIFFLNPDGRKTLVLKETINRHPLDQKVISLEVERFDPVNGGSTYYGRQLYHFDTQEPGFWWEEFYDPESGQLVFEHGIELDLNNLQPHYVRRPAGFNPQLGASLLLARPFNHYGLDF
jgi:hypothetical protein